MVGSQDALVKALKAGLQKQVSATGRQRPRQLLFFSVVFGGFCGRNKVHPAVRPPPSLLSDFLKRPPGSQEVRGHAPPESVPSNTRLRGACAGPKKGQSGGRIEVAEKWHLEAATLLGHKAGLSPKGAHATKKRVLRPANACSHEAGSL